MDFDKTMSFNFEKEKNARKKEILKEVYEAFETAKKSDKPFAIIAKTIKGKGVSFMENKSNSRIYFIWRPNIYN